MYRKYLLTAALVAAVAAPAVAATKYMVSQDKTTHKCYVVTKIGKNGMQIGTATYATKTLAQAALTAAPECTPKT
jgi:uncharacterized membrane protein